MCGICGIYNPGPGSPFPEALIAGMNALLHHRGPDGGGVYCSPDGRIALGNRRLAIIDLSPAGRQPMSNEDGTIWIAYNGEVYNFRELRSQLENAGHRFRSQTDTEVLIHLYEQNGPEMVNSLRGMFAFAIWDGPRRRLMLARDRVGIKPLYYAQAGETLIFASEIKAIFQSAQIKPALNRDAVLQYAAFGYVAPPDTLFVDVKKLEPGCWMLVEGREPKIQRYWDVFDDVLKVDGRSEEEVVRQTLAELEEAVKIRLVADVPVGVFLSGGIDSSLIAALAARNTSGPLKTFTLGFRGYPEYNELNHARKVAGFLQAEHHEIMIGPEEIQAFYPKFLEHQEEPNLNPIWFAIYFVSKLARDNGVIVVLSGDGGDELYAGYNRWLEYLRLQRYSWGSLKHLPAFAKKMAAASGRLLRSEGQREILRRGLAGEALFWGGTAYKAGQLSQMLAPDLLPNGNLWEKLPLARWWDSFETAYPAPASELLNWMTYAGLKGGLLEDFLMRLDKMGMAASVEGRVPFLDHRFIAHSLSIPVEMKAPGYQNKRLLREAARLLLPPEIVDRPKRGFCAPGEAWIRQAFGKQLWAGVERLQAEQDLFNPVWLRTRLDGGASSSFSQADWALLSLGQWYSRWIAA